MNAWKQITLACLSLLILGLAPVSPALAQVRVTAATPSSAYQGTIALDVVVNGSGFDPTAKVQFFVSGTTNPGGIAVRKVVFRNPKEVVATIDVTDAAVLDYYDIQVVLDSGRKGKGTTLFSVKAKGAPAQTVDYTGENLGTLSGDGMSDAWDVNAQGHIVGRSIGSSVRGFYWDGSMHQLPMSSDARNAPPYSVAWDVEANAISGGPSEIAVGYENRTVCETRNGPCYRDSYPILWQGDLSQGPEAVRLDTAQGSAQSINHGGTFVVGYVAAESGGGAGAVWKQENGAWSRSGIPLSYFSCNGCEYDWGIALDVNDAGIVIGIVSRKADYAQFAYLYDTRTAAGRILPLPPGYLQSGAWAVGEVVGGKVHVAGVVSPCSGSSPCSTDRAIRWTIDTNGLATTFEILDQLAWAEGVTGEGFVTGTMNTTASRRGNVIQTAMLWKPSAGYISLKPATGGSDSTSRSMATGGDGTVFVVGETNAKGTWTAVRWVIP
jgi:hypothetical protein